MASETGVINEVFTSTSGTINRDNGLDPNPVQYNNISLLLNAGDKVSYDIDSNFVITNIVLINTSVSMETGVVNEVFSATAGTINRDNGIDPNPIQYNNATIILKAGDKVSYNIDANFVISNIVILDSSPADQGEVKTGVITGDLSINSGKVVTLKAATLNGKVKMKGGKLIIKSNSTINGKIEGEHHVELFVYDSTVTGSIHITNSLNVDLFHSNITGSVELENNATVSVVNCTIGGKLKLAHNTNVNQSGNTVHG